MKFETFQSPRNKKFYFNLKSNNGQVILTSQGYEKKISCTNGIKSVQKNCGDDNCFQRKVAKNGKHHFSLIAKNKQIVGTSQMYASRTTMENGVKAVKRVAPQAVVEARATK